MKTCRVLKARFYKTGRYGEQDYTYMIPDNLVDNFKIGDYAVVPSSYDKYSVVLVTDVFDVSKDVLDKATTINGKKIALKYVLAHIDGNYMYEMMKLNEV